MKERPEAQVQEYLEAAKAAAERDAYSEAEMMLCLAVREAETLASDESCMLENCRRELAMALIKQGALKAALNQLELAIDAYDKRFGPDNFGTATCLVLSGHIHDSLLTKSAPAEPLLKRAIAIFEKFADAGIGDPAVEKTLLILNLDAHLILGNNLRKFLRDTEAEAYFRLGMKMTDNCPELEHRRELFRISLSGMAKSIIAKARRKALGGFSGQADTDGAAPLFESGIQILESTEDPGHEEILAALEDLALHHASADRHEESEQARHRALTHAERRFGEDSIEIVGRLRLLAESYEPTGKYQEATALRRRVLDIQENNLDETHPDVCSALVDLALSYDLEGKHQAAEPFYARYFAVTPVDEIERLIYCLDKAGELPGYRFLEMATWIRQRLGDRVAT